MDLSIKNLSEKPNPVYGRFHAINSKPITFERELLKDKTEKEILEVEENWREYMQVVWEISQSIELEKGGKDSDLDDLDEFLWVLKVRVYRGFDQND